jgi:hypothetical protein
MKSSRLLASAFVAVAVLLSPLASAPTASAQVLKQVPHDANVVIKINKLKAVSDKIAGLSQKLGIAQFKPAFADPLGNLKKEGKLTNGLDDNGEAAIVFLNTPGPRKGEPAFLLLLPVTDYKAFVGNFQGANTVGDVTTMKFAGNPDDAFAVNWGNYAAISNTKQSVANKPDGVTASGLAAKELASKDIVAFVNLKAARSWILPKITQQRAFILKQVEQGMLQQNAPRRRAPGAAPGAAPAPAPAANAQQQKMVPLMKAIVNRAIDIAEQVVRDGDAVTYGISIDDAGINSTGALEFAAGSPSAAQMGQIKNTDSSLLAGLPQTKYLMIGGYAGSPEAMGSMITAFFQPIQAEFATLGEQGKSLQNYVDAVKVYLTSSKSTAFGMIAPSGMLGQEAIVQTVSVSTGNAPAMLEALKQAFNSQQMMMDLFSAGGQINAKATYTANAKTVDGVQFNQMQTSFAAPPGQQQTPQQMQMQQMMAFMYGPGGVNALTGQIGADKILAASGLPDPVLAQAVAAAKAGQDVLGAAAPVQATAQHLPKQRFAAVYVGLDHIAMTAANYAKAFGMPINFQLPENLPPIGITGATEGSAVRFDGHVPAQTLQSLIAAVMQTYMQMQGGQQPGGPAGL